MPTVVPVPTLKRESDLWAAGTRYVAGIDEAGRGALAGPVVAAAVVLSPDATFTGVWTEVRDSKLLNPQQREALDPEIRQHAAAYSIGAATAAEIDQVGIVPATRRAMVRAIHGLAIEPAHLLIDWVELPELNILQTCWARAESECVSVAAASILAKVARDRMLVELDARFPDFGFARHKGYFTEEHRTLLARHGPCPEHRRSFAPVAQWRTLFEVTVDHSPQGTDADGDGPA